MTLVLGFIAPDDDISVGLRPCALLVGDRIVQSPAIDTGDDSSRSIRKSMAEIVIMLVFFYVFFNMALSFVNSLPPLLSILCKSLPGVYDGDVAFR